MFSRWKQTLTLLPSSSAPPLATTADNVPFPFTAVHTVTWFASRQAGFPLRKVQKCENSNQTNGEWSRLEERRGLARRLHAGEREEDRIIKRKR